jgi:DNA-binding transcriptional MerR regulator
MLELLKEDDQMEKTYLIGEFSKLTGVTVRTLRYYEQKEILVPKEHSKDRHRLYQKEDLKRLQQILTLKYLDYSLEEIAAYLKQESLNMKDELAKQKRLLEQKQQKLNSIIQTITRAEAVVKDGTIHHDLILGLIHAYQHEDKQKEWIDANLSMPPSLLTFVYEQAEEERSALEQELTKKLLAFQSFYEENRPVTAPEVQQNAKEFYNLLSNNLTPNMAQDLFNMRDELEEAQKEMEASPLFQNSILTLETEAYMMRVFEMLEP